MKKTLRIIFILVIIQIIGITGIYSRTFQEVVKSKVIRIGISDESVPFHFINSAGDFEGFDIDLATLISQKFLQDYSVKTEWVPGMYPDNKETNIETDQVDIVVSAYSILESRKNRVTFSIPYFIHDGLGMIVHKDKISELTELEMNNFPFQTVCYQGGSTGSRYVIKKIRDRKYIPVATPWNGIEKVIKKEVPCFIADFPTLSAYCNKIDSIKMVYSPFNLNNQKDTFGVGMKKNDNKMKIYLDSLIRECRKQGILSHMERKWLGNE